MLARLKFKIEPLVNDILNRLPKWTWTRTDVTFLDPAMGGGQFVKEIERRLRENGRSNSYINKHVYGCEEELLWVNYAVNKNNLKGNYSVGGLEKEWTMKFDVIVGNPPYQHPTNKSIKLWAVITNNAYSFLKENGILAFITPNAWMLKPETRGFKPATEIFNTGLFYVKESCSQYFPNIGEKIGYWIIKKNYQGPAKIQLETGQEKNLKYLNSALINNDILNLLSKLKNEFSKNKVLRKHKVIDFYYSTVAAINKGELSLEKNKKYNIPVFISANKTAYTTIDKITPCYKLILNKSGYYYSTKNKKYMIIPNTKLYGVGENGVGVPVSSIKEAKNAKTVFSSKVFRFYIDNEKTSGFNSGLLDLPILDFSKSWSDKELYKHFGLTKDEIKLIEDTIKD